VVSGKTTVTKNSGHEEQWTNEHALRGIELYDSGDYLIDQFLGVSFNQEEQEIYDKHWIAIQTYMLEKQRSWILGTANVNQEWAEYQRVLESLGMSKVLEAMQSAYDRQYSE